MIKLLLDQGLPRSAVQYLSDGDMHTLHVGNIGAFAASDEEILELARRDGRIVVTLDADFHALLALSGASSPSVIRVRIEGLRGQDLAQLLRDTLSICHEELRQGALVTVQDKRIRLRLLPLIR